MGGRERWAGSPALAALCHTVAAGVLLQAALAGLFLSGVDAARTVHLIVGWLLPYFALVVAVVALVQRRRGQASRRVVIGTVVLPVALWVQEVLGAVPQAATTAVHVPLGVGLFAYALLLGLAATRPPADPASTSALRTTSGEESEMSDDDGSRTTYRTARLVVLVVAGLVIANLVAAATFERDPALGIDELLVAVVGVSLALIVEFGVFRRSRS